MDHRISHSWQRKMVYSVGLLLLVAGCTTYTDYSDGNGVEDLQDTGPQSTDDAGNADRADTDGDDAGAAEPPDAAGDVDPDQDSGPVSDVEDVDTDPVAIELPTVISHSVESITATAAVGHGHVSNDGGATVTERGFCWGSEPEPTVESGSCTTEGAGTGDFSSSLGPLSASTSYEARAYATNSAGTAYGTSIPFESSAEEPIAPEDELQILVLFLEWNPELGVVALSQPVDIKINGQWHYLHGLDENSPEWDVEVPPYTARGKIITLEGPVEEIDFNLEQVVDPSLNNEGFGYFNIKLRDRHPDTDFSLGIHMDGDPDDLNYLNQSYTTGGYWSRSGFNLSPHDNPWFPHFIFDGQETTPGAPWGSFNPSISDSGRLMVIVAGQGWEHPNPSYD